MDATRREESITVSHEGQFSFEITEDGKPIEGRSIDDPFIRARLTLKGFIAAWKVLTKGITLRVSVDGTRAAHNVIFRGDYDDAKWFPGGPMASHITGEVNRP